MTDFSRNLCSWITLFWLLARRKSNRNGMLRKVEKAADEYVTRRVTENENRRTPSRCLATFCLPKGNVMKTGQRVVRVGYFVMSGNISLA